MSIRDLIRWDRPYNVAVRQDPYGSSLASLQDQMNRLFDHFYKGMQVQWTDWDKLPATAPAVNITENAQGFTATAEIAGIRPEDLDVEVGEGYLAIKGEKKDEQKEEKGNYIREEISYGSFYRTFPLPQTADNKKAEATFKNGVLTITIPKKAEAVSEPKKVEVKKVA